MGCQSSTLKTLGVRPEDLETRRDALQRYNWRGRWYIAQSTYDGWLSGDRLHPNYHFAMPVEPQEGHAQTAADESANADTRLIERLQFDVDGEARQQTGVDTQDSDNPARFTWRGGTLDRTHITGDWYIVAADHDAGVAAIVLTKTEAAPDMIDILIRDPSTLDRHAELIRAFKAKILKIKRFAPLVDLIQTLPDFDATVKRHRGYAETHRRPFKVTAIAT